MIHHAPCAGRGLASCTMCRAGTCIMRHVQDGDSCTITECTTAVNIWNKVLNNSESVSLAGCYQLVAYGSVINCITVLLLLLLLPQTKQCRDRQNKSEKHGDWVVQPLGHAVIQVVLPASLIHALVASLSFFLRIVFMSCQ